MLTRDMLTGPKALQNYSVAVVGLGVSNIPVIRFLMKYGARITACDRKEREYLSKEVIELEKLGLEIVSGVNYLDVICDRRFDLIIRSPGIRPDKPQFITAINNGSDLSSEIELVFELCHSPIVGVTGSDGKTTTTTLIYEMLKESGLQVHLGGNIGTPLIEEVINYNKSDIVVLELSSFQLMTMKKSPKYSLITNLSPNHLDYHRSYQEYVDAKSNIYNWQLKSDILVINKDNDETYSIFKETNNRALLFSRKTTVSKGAYLLDNNLYLVDGECKSLICNVNDLKLVGTHNIENVLAASTLAYEVGADLASITHIAKTFAGVEHRIEFVREVNGVKYYNDSIASSPTRAIAGLNSFNEDIILIAGGSDKYVPFDKLGDKIAEKVKALVLLGKTADKIYDAATVALADKGKSIPIIKVNSLEKAVNIASKKATVGDIVLLSPACASFDMFKNFVERGVLFKQYVNLL